MTCLLLQSGKTALMWAAELGSRGTVAMLLERNALALVNAENNVSIALGCLVLCLHCSTLVFDVLLSGSALYIAYMHACVSVRIACQLLLDVSCVFGWYDRCLARLS